MIGNDKPRISIGMPVFNGENFIAQALDSTLAQTYSNFELIISDNASTDSTQEICIEFQKRDPRIRYYRLKDNQGAAKNYNWVFDLSIGEYFKWSAHDDLLAPQFLESCIKVLDCEETVVLAYPASFLVNEKGTIYREYDDDLDLRSETPHERFAKFLKNPGLCHQIFGLIRSETLRRTARIGNYPRSDRNLLGELSLYGKFYKIPERIFYRRTHANTSTEANVTEYELAVWFDPSKKGKLVLPRWRRLVEYVKAINRAPISLYEKSSCILLLGQFLLVPERVFGMFEDLKVISKLSSTHPKQE